MSAHFAIPATTFVLKALIEQQLKIAYGAATAPTVSIAPPPRPPATNGEAKAEAPGLILYMHHAGPNLAWRNMAAPYIEDDASRSTRTPLVLDLHYMVAALGSSLEREALLGIAMAAFHRNAIVLRSKVKAILDAVDTSGATDLIDLLTTEPLADPRAHPESIKISLNQVDIEMSTKLWSALQAAIRPSAYYLVTTTILDTDDSIPDGPTTTQVTVKGRPSPDPDSPLDLDRLDYVVVEGG